MKFTVIVLGAPGSSTASQSALNFCRALTSASHQLQRVFFYGEGVHNATELACPPQDEIHLPNAWQAFISEHQLDAVVCIAAALRRGIINNSEAARYNKSAANLSEHFDLSGLGQLITSCAQSDRVITFG